MNDPIKRAMLTNRMLVKMNRILFDTSSTAGMTTRSYLSVPLHTILAALSVM